MKVDYSFCFHRTLLLRNPKVKPAVSAAAHERNLRRPGKGAPTARPYVVTVGGSVGCGGPVCILPTRQPRPTVSTRTHDSNAVGAPREGSPSRPPEGCFSTYVLN